jgi:hypothetical protein
MHALDYMIEPLDWMVTHQGAESSVSCQPAQHVGVDSPNAACRQAHQALEGSDLLVLYRLPSVVKELTYSVVCCSQLTVLAVLSIHKGTYITFTLTLVPQALQSLVNII